MTSNFEVWKDKDLSSLFKDIYQNQRSTQTQITLLIDVLKPLINSASDAAVIVPLIRDYLDVSVKNDSHLVRLASIVQRLYATEKLISSQGGSDGFLTEEEKQNLLKQADDEIKLIQAEIVDDTKKLEATKEETKEQIKKLTVGKDENGNDGAVD